MTFDKDDVILAAFRLIDRAIEAHELVVMDTDRARFLHDQLCAGFRENQRILTERYRELGGR